MSNESVWQAKLLAWVHDPAEKAFVLLRDPAGHEGGTVSKLKETLFPEGVPDDLDRIVHLSDRWASAADRPQFPQERGTFGPQVRFYERPVLTHPLSGDQVPISEGFRDIDVGAIKNVSIDHFSRLVRREGDEVDFRKTFLTFWRRGPEEPAKGLGAIWKLLPADTRVPDHTIWSHLDLTSAFAGAWAADPEGGPALLSMSFGPVQGFIEQARTTSDLWAGSHLLSSIVWQGLRLLVEEVGPDAVIFPQLRGVPVVDLWLHEVADIELPDDWSRYRSDAHPLFVAALPNRFLAIVPQRNAAELAKTITEETRRFVKDEMREAFSTIVREAGLNDRDDLHGHIQGAEQVAELPEVQWAAVPWSLVPPSGNGVDTTRLQKAQKAFYPDGDTGFLDSQAWKTLSNPIGLGQHRFYDPNPGVLYPALFELVERALDSCKMLRVFKQVEQKGARCTLCGEREWLTTDVNHLRLHPGQRQQAATVWSRLHEKKPALCREGEHLCGWCTLKRVWPRRFVDIHEKQLGSSLRRYVVSTHALAMSPGIERALERGGGERTSKERLQLEKLLLTYKVDYRAALPRRLTRNLSDANDYGDLLKKVPVLMDLLREQASAGGTQRDTALEDLVSAERILKGMMGRVEDYYALIMMDGDRMGAWLSGDQQLQTTYRQAWHSEVLNEISRAGIGNVLSPYLDSPRPPSPARHAAVSLALNSFSIGLVRAIVEDMHKGKLIYAGGDDVFAMVAVDDLASCMLVLRLAYSGTMAGDADALRKLLNEQVPFRAHRGYVLHEKRLHRMMGEKATASAGAIVAHHTAPLGMVLRELRETKHKSKQWNGGKRDAFCLRVLKRSGSHVQLVAPWALGDDVKNLSLIPAGILIRLIRLISDQDFSRRAIYQSLEWLRLLPEKGQMDEESRRDLLTRTLVEQFRRQSGRNTTLADAAAELAKVLVDVALCNSPTGTDSGSDTLLTDLLGVGEFLGRSVRVTGAPDNRDNLTFVGGTP